MAIENITGRMRVPLSNNTSQKAEIDHGAKTAAKAAERADSVAITAVAQEIKKTLEASSSSTVIDMDRVAAVKKALAEGSYQINAESIANKMIEHEQFLSRLDKARK